MPRPTATQLVYGSATVFLSTLAMLLLSQTETGIGVAVIAIAGLGLGLLVAMTVPMPAASRVVRRGSAPEARPQPAPPAAPAPLRAVPAPVEARVGEHSR
ncbi:hypothetical protein [Streptomyces chattanoogensis]|uniref:Uncharacterized protein n=1 Tax=Streptomyces chattanoogensis TaxID=66876 RepID=A0A0N0XZD7_9ACTN|nr:hypothetical protein [Streptomyces chattanoogensis]AJT66827.1 hypothetical protein T261_5196 [Streptomyces lydicus]KPC64855.1 hypothetical protein ADL29_09495 [Streptomyces chattanoogensis]